MPFSQSMLLGVRNSTGFFISTFLFGILFGVASASAGISQWLAVVMSIVVFSASVQFAVLEFWQTPFPLGSILLTVSLLSTRLVLLGLSLTHHLPRHSMSKRLLLLGFLNDPAAVTAIVLGDHVDKLAYLTGYGLSLMTSWALATWLGYSFVDTFATANLESLDYAGPLVMSTIMVLFVKRSNAPALPWVLSGLIALSLHLLNVSPQWILPLAVIGGVVPGVVVARRKRVQNV